MFQTLSELYQRSLNFEVEAQMHFIRKTALQKYVNCWQEFYKNLKYFFHVHLSKKCVQVLSVCLSYVYVMFKLQPLIVFTGNMTN